MDKINRGITRGIAAGWLNAGCTLMTVMTAVMTAGCASTPSASATPAVSSAGMPAANQGVLGMLGSVADSALGAVGLKKPETPAVPTVPDSALPDYRIDWRIYASDSLNIDEQGHALALVVRLFRLKSPDAFLKAPYDTFGDAAKEKAALGDDLVSAREVQLVPGQHHEAVDKVPREARYVGIVALYRQPLPDRWRYAFNSAEADKSGLHIGAHACAMSVQVGEAVGVAPPSTRAVAAFCPP